MSETETPELDAKPAPKSSKLIPLALVFNTLLVVGVLAVVLLRSGDHAAAPAKKGEAHGEAAHGEEAKGGEEGAPAPVAESSGFGPTLHLADFVIRLRNLDADRYARISFEVEVGSEGDKTELTKRTAIIRDAIIGYLSDRTLEELRGSDGLGNTKKVLLARLAEISPGTRVKALYITDFVVQ